MVKNVHIAERAVQKIVAAAVASVPGTISHSAGFDRLTGRSYPRYDIQLDEDGDAVSIETFIAVTWPSPVIDVAAAVRETVARHVEIFTGIPVMHVNVVVGPVISCDQRVSTDRLTLSDPTPHPVHARPLTVRNPPRLPEPQPLSPIRIRRTH